MPPDAHTRLMNRIVTAFPEAAMYVKKFIEEQRRPTLDRRAGLYEGDGISDFAESLIQKNGAGDEQLKSLLQFIEREYESGDEARRAIQPFISGVTYMPDSIRRDLFHVLPPHLKREVEPSELAKQLCLDLAAADPWLEKFVRGEIDYCEEILPHVIVGDLFGQVLERMESHGENDHIVTKVLEVLENALQTDPTPTAAGPTDVIAVSFLYAMPYQGEHGGKLAEMLPSALRAELEKQNPDWAAEQRAKT